MCGRFQPSAQPGEALDRRPVRRPAYRLQRKRRLSHGCRYCRSHYCSSCHLDSEYRIGGVGSLFVPLVRLQTRELTLAAFSRFFFFFFLSARLLRLLRLLPLFPPCLSLPLLPSARRTSKSSTSFSFPSESELILLSSSFPPGASPPLLLPALLHLLLTSESRDTPVTLGSSNHLLLELEGFKARD